MTKTDSTDVWEVIRYAVPKEMWPELEAKPELAAAVAASREVREYYVDTENRIVTDYLTGLNNTRVLGRALKREIERAYRGKRPLTLQFADLDDFKGINDDHGHVEGDRVLMEIGKAYRSSCRISDVPFRYGGDEFGVLMPDIDLEQGIAATKRISERIPQRMSFGLACYHPKSDQDTIGPAEIISLADRAMYKAKDVRNGKSNIYVYRDGGFVHID